MPEQPTNLKINGERFWDSLMEMAKIGATPKGGCNRQTLTDLDRQGRDLFKRWCEAAGCTVSVDELGNMMALRPGKDPALPPVAIGSHLDTQPTGGKFDGVAGVLAGLEVVRTLNDYAYETDHPILVLNWTNEEGTRFAPAMLASGVWCGQFTKQFAYDRADRDGKRFGEELARIGYQGELPCAPQRWKCHLELHIEQGPILEAEDKTIGVVTGAQGQRWYEVTITGKESHAGSTPMSRRKDALVAAARLILAVEAIGREHGGVTTVGVIDAKPASRNIIPGSCFLTIDARNPSDDALTAMDAAIRAALEAACTPAALPFEIEQILHYPAIHFDQTCIAAVREAAIAGGYSWQEITSGPGHDSCYTARHVPTSMVFIPCKDGLSHNEEESAEPEHLTAGCDVVLRAALEMAKAG